MKPFNSPTGSVWWFSHRGILDIFVVLDGCVIDAGTACRRVLVLHSDDEVHTQMGEYSVAVGSPYNDGSTRIA